MQRMRDQAKFQEAMDKQKDMEEKLRAKVLHNYVCITVH